MSGLSGCFSQSISRDTVSRLSAMQAHRGNESQHFFFDKAALSVRFAKDLAAATAKCKDFLLIFDGKLFNKDTLIKKYNKLPAKGSDATIFLALFAEYGTKIFGKTDGIFSAIIYNRKTGEMFAIRDSLGVKPLCYARSDKTLYLASEIKALVAVCPQTKIKIIKPACFFDGHRQIVYKKINFKTLRQNTNIKTALVKTLDTATREILRDVQDTHCGILLSGGLDSSIVAYHAQKYCPQIRAYVIGVEGSSDLEYAALTAKFLHVPLDIEILTEEMILSAVKDIIRITENYNKYTVINAIPVYYTARKAKADGINTVLLGDGSDELFGGYDFFYNYYTYATLNRSIKNSLLQIHKTECQRTDRVFGSQAITAFTPFLSQEVVKLALTIKKELKYKDGIEKFILRQAYRGKLPTAVTDRKKSNLYLGTGIAGIVSAWADTQISTARFEREKVLYQDWKIRSKEELLFFYLWKEIYPQLFAYGPTYYKRKDTAFLNIGINFKTSI